MATSKKIHGGMQLPLLTPESDWRPPDMSTLPSWAGAERVCVDVETRDPHLRELGIGVRRGGYVVGVAFAVEDGPTHYLPLRHEGGDNVDEQGALRYLRDQAKTFDGEVVGANLSYDLDYLWEEDVFFPEVEFYRDIQIADPLIDELQQSFSLANIAERYGVPGKDETLLEEAAAAYGVSPKGGLWRLPARYVGAYGEGDVDRPLRILRKQEKRLDDQDLWDVFDLESRVLPVLVRMRRRGVRVDMERLFNIENWVVTEVADQMEIVRRDTGYRVGHDDVWSAEKLAAPLREIGVPLGKTKTGAPHIDKAVLDSVNHPVARAIAQARKVSKIGQFAASIRRYQVGGRIHCTFNQIAREDDKGDQRGARYGRLSGTDPNMQQQPYRNEFGKMWRSIYVPEEGSVWNSADYSQQEPRWTTHYAAELDLPGARDTAAEYTSNPLLDNHDFMAQLTGLERKYAKNVYLGLCYGEGGAKLSRDCGLPTRWALNTGRWRDRKTEFFQTREEAFQAKAKAGEGYVYETAGVEGQEIIDKFDERAPFIRRVADKAKKQATKNGYVVTGGGRKLHFPQKQDGTYDWVHKALNRVIQGTSADQMKRAMVAIDRDVPDLFLQLQVHDEVDFSESDPKRAEQVCQIMREALPSKWLPFRVDLERGPSWGEIE